MDSWSLEWWLWLVLGLALLAGELLTPGGVFLLFFGVGALVVGLLGALGLALPLVVQLLVFSATSVVSLLVFRRPILARLESRGPAAQLGEPQGSTAVALDDIEVDATGKVELHGSPWSARNVGAGPVLRGDQCVVEEADGLTLRVRGTAPRRVSAATRKAADH